MRKVREILRLKLDKGKGNRPVAKACRISPSTVSDCMTRFKASGLTWPLPEELDEQQLEDLLYPGQPMAEDPRPVPDWAAVHRELRKKHVTLELLWQEYREAEPEGYGYSWYCREYGEYRSQLDVVMRQSHKLGEKAFVDFAGDTVPIADPETGEVRQAKLFVGVLGASNYTYAEACWSEDIPNWIRAHVRMLEYFGGVPEIIVPDNLKSGVRKPDYYDPDINPTYQELAEHYSTVVMPARVRKPRDKAKVENAVLVAERWILAALRNRTFWSLGELNDAVWRKLAELNDRPFQKLPGSRRSVFEQEELSELQPLPARPYQYSLRKRARVHIDYHVEIEGHYYSVPWQLSRQMVDVRLAPATIEIFHLGKRVATHSRSYFKGKATTLLEHMPARHRERAEWTPKRLIEWARKLGPCTAEMVETLLEKWDPPELAFRSCLGVIRLGEKYGPDRLDAACSVALQQGCIKYSSVKSILDKGLDKQEPLAKQERLPGVPRHHENVRGPDYYH